MATLENLRLSGWKSIKEAEIDFRRLNVLVGANGAGKSNLVSFFRLLGEMMVSRLQKAVLDAGGPDAQLHYGVKRTKRLESHLTFATEQGPVDYDCVFDLTALANG